MSIEAMKQALEALDIGLEYAESELYENRRRYEGYMHLAPDDQAYVNQIKEAITSLRQAIEQAEKQEPVAVVNSTISGHIDWLCVVFPKQGTKLYTAPQPQREWQGLTDEEIALVCAKCAASAHNWNDISFAHAIEAKLKDKNHVS